MAFDSLSDKMQNVFKKLKSKGLLEEADVKRIANLKGCVGYETDPDTAPF